MADVRPRLSISVSGSECSSQSSLDGDTASLITTTATPPSTAPGHVLVDQLVVAGGGAGVVNGCFNSYTVNTFIVPTPGDDWSPDTVKDLVTDAVTVASDKNAKIFPASACDVIGEKEALRGLQRRWCLLIASLVALSFLTLLCASLFTMIGLGTKSVPTPFDDTTSLPDVEGGPRIMSRAAWVAQPPSSPIAPNAMPIHQVIVCHTAADSCNSTTDCILKVRYLQMFHMGSFKWSDIGYNYLVGGDGSVYEGRGWDKEGAHTKGYNVGTLGVAFIGTYVHQVPSPLQIEVFGKLMNIGVKFGKISPDYSLVAQCQLKQTAAPGLALVQQMKTWPHFDSSLPFRCTES